MRAMRWTIGVAVVLLVASACSLVSAPKVRCFEDTVRLTSKQTQPDEGAAASGITITATMTRTKCVRE
jgi:hypothetical protein